MKTTSLLDSVQRIKLDDVTLNVIIYLIFVPLASIRILALPKKVNIDKFIDTTEHSEILYACTYADHRLRRTNGAFVALFIEFTVKLKFCKEMDPFFIGYG